MVDFVEQDAWCFGGISSFTGMHLAVTSALCVLGSVKHVYIHIKDVAPCTFYWDFKSCDFYIG